MFGIASFSFIFDDWRLAMQVDICQNLFRQSFAVALSPNFLLPKFFTVRYVIIHGNYLLIIL